jgi:hypothetical protein
MEQHEIVHADLSGAYPIQQFFYFCSGSPEVELAKGHLTPQMDSLIAFFNS